MTDRSTIVGNGAGTPGGPVVPGSVAPGAGLATDDRPPGGGAAGGAPVTGADTVDHWQGRLWQALRTAPGPALRLGLLVAVVLGLAGAAAELRGPTTYSSKAVMLIDDPYQLATAGTDGQLVKLEALRVKYSALIDTSAIAKPVADQLHLPVGAVLQSVSGLVPLDSLLMDVDATWSTPKEATLLAQATAKEVTAYVAAEDATYGIPAKDQFTLTVIDPAATATPSGPSAAHALVLGVGLAVLGLVLGFGAAQLVRNRRLLR